ncbi:hypothetical protein CRM22_001772 [Opisthorchis felineus]|uniref:Uncharacterized protein n=1 Tax=Opisthorchis felineus TaxID=147828 RepID=A0A4S2M925_OPIFE|nr:hypothetical protein CRM22_001772 [Opisthorchis felineus]
MPISCRHIELICLQGICGEREKILTSEKTQSNLSCINAVLTLWKRWLRLRGTSNAYSDSAGPKTNASHTVDITSSCAKSFASKAVCLNMVKCNGGETSTRTNDNAVFRHNIKPIGTQTSGL